MTINGISTNNSAKFNYSALKTATNKNFAEIEKGFTEKAADEDSSENSSFTNLLNSLLGGVSNTKTNKVKSPYGEYKPSSYGSDEQSTYEQLTNGTMTLSKFYTGVRYQKYLKKAKEFEKLLHDLLVEAKQNNASAIEALSVIQGMLAEVQKSGSSNSPEKTLANLMAKIDKYIADFEKFRELHPEKVSKQQAQVADLMSSLISRTINDSGQEKIDNISRYADKARRFDDKKSEQDFYDVMSDKVKQKNIYDPTKSTKKYLKKREREEEVNSKIQEIVRFRSGAERATANEEISKIVNDIGKTEIESENVYEFDFNRLNCSVQSPIFA